MRISVSQDNSEDQFINIGNRSLDEKCSENAKYLIYNEHHCSVTAFRSFITISEGMRLLGII